MVKKGDLILKVTSPYKGRKFTVIGPSPYHRGAFHCIGGNMSWARSFYQKDFVVLKNQKPKFEEGETVIGYSIDYNYEYRIGVVEGSNSLGSLIRISGVHPWDVEHTLKYVSNKRLKKL